MIYYVKEDIINKSKAYFVNNNIIGVIMRKAVIKGIYRHFKGNYYIVEDIGCDCETLDELVIYRALYDEHKLWVRRKEDFLSEVDHKKYPDVKQKYRFEYLKNGIK